jgi:hypothetical protein
VKTLFVVVASLSACFVSGCQESAVASAPAASCSACHQGERSFSGRDVETLAGEIRKIRDGKVKHPPLRLDDSGDAAVYALAERLTQLP